MIRLAASGMDMFRPGNYRWISHLQHRCSEAIATSRDRLDIKMGSPVVSQNLPEHANRLGQVCLFDICVGPTTLQQLKLLDDMATVLYQNLKYSKCLYSEVDGLVRA